MPREVEDDDNDEFEPPQPPAMPGTVKAAGIIWIGVGGLSLFNVVVNLALSGDNPGEKNPGGALGGTCCPLFTGIAFLYCGLQTLKGTAQDTRGNGIGSIMLGCLQLLLAVALLTIMGLGAKKNDEPEMAIVVSALLGFIGLTLVIAGILALAGRKGYMIWRKANSPKSKKRDRDRDEQDNRDQR